MSKAVTSASARPSPFCKQVIKLEALPRPFSLLLAIISTVVAQSAATQTLAGTSLNEAAPGTLLPGIGRYSSTNDRKPWSFTPRLILRTTYSNNIALTQEKQHGFITEISPGLNISNNGSRIKGFFDYSLQRVLYSNDTSLNSTHRTLSTRFNIEAINNWLFVDVSGTITRQPISAFGSQTSDTSRTNPNVAEVSNYRVSPYIQGKISDLADYRVRYAETISRTGRSELASDARITELQGSLSEERANNRVAWTLQASSRNNDFKNGRDTKSDQVTGILSYSVFSSLKVLILGGKERNNYLTLDNTSYTIYGYGLKWRPNERTQIDAEYTHRFFGQGHRITLSNRLSRLGWQYSDIKDVVFARGLDGAANPVTSLYDNLYAQFATIEPDPVKRVQLVNNFIQANGLNAASLIGTGFLTSEMILQRRQIFSLSAFGARNTFTLVANNTNSRPLNSFSLANDDFAFASRVRQYGYGVQFTHALGMGDTLGAQYFAQKSQGSETLQRTVLQTYLVNYNHQYNIKTLMSVGARHTRYEGAVNPYSELAVYGQLTVRF